MIRTISTKKLKAGDLIVVGELTNMTPDYYLVMAVSRKLALYYLGSLNTAPHSLETTHFNWKCNVYRLGEPMDEGFDLG